jgi:hypothetical protein
MRRLLEQTQGAANRQRSKAVASIAATARIDDALTRS